MLRLLRPLALLSLPLLAAACTADPEPDTEAAVATDAAAAVEVSTAVAVERPIPRFIAVTGTLAAQEQADVAAEVAGRVVATPVERGTLVKTGEALVQIADTDVRAQVEEAAANAAQIEARLGLAGGGTFDIDRVPEVANARASADLARAEFERATSLTERNLLSRAEFDRSRAQADVAARQYDIARNGAEQQYQSLLASRARLTVARKALADTVVRAPFDGIVDMRAVSIGDYVTRGARVASVMRTTPLRVELTVPGQHIAAVGAGRTVSLEVDAYPGRTFTGRVRYVSAAVQTDSRALIVEAVVPNETGELKPGQFATARIEQVAPTPAVLVPASAVRSDSTAARVFVVARGAAEERIVTTGQTVGDLVEIESGVAAGDVVITSHVAQLTDGARVAEAR